MRSTDTLGQIERDILVEATPQRVFDLLTVAREHVKWEGTDADINAYTGGSYRILVAGKYPQAGEFIEVVPNTRIVMTQGWDVAGAVVPRGASTVEYSLAAEAAGTRLSVVHRGVPHEAMPDVSNGWDHYLRRLCAVARGDTVESDAPAPTTMEATRELTAFEAACTGVLSLAETLGPDDFARATRCPPLTIKDLLAHLSQSLEYGVVFIDTAPEGPPTMDRITMWSSFPEGVDDRVVNGALERAGGRSGEDVITDLRREVDRLTDAARSLPPTYVAGFPGFCMPLVDMIACRVVELSVHTLDLQHALGRPQIHPDGLYASTKQIFDGLLGSPLPSALEWSATTHALAASGRRPLTNDERAILGPSAERFPLFG